MQNDLSWTHDSHPDRVRIDRPRHTKDVMPMAMLLMIFYYPLLKLWDKASSRYSFQWLLARLLLTMHRPGERERSCLIMLNHFANEAIEIGWKNT